MSPAAGAPALPLCVSYRGPSDPSSGTAAWGCILHGIPTAEPAFLLRSCMDDFRELRARYRQPLHCTGCQPACGECRAAPGRLVSVAGSAARNLPGVAQQGTSMLSWPCRLLARGSGARGAPSPPAAGLSGNPTPPPPPALRLLDVCTL